MIFFLLINAFCRPQYNPTIDQKQLTVSGSEDTILREEVIEECSIDNLEKLIIKNGIVSVGSYAFQNAKKLSTIIFDTTKLLSLEAYCFCRCESLISVILPDGLTTIKENVFEGCVSLTEVTLPPTISSINPLLSFLDCKKFTKIKMNSSGVFSVNSDQNILIYNYNVAYLAAFGAQSIIIPDEIEIINDQFACNSLITTVIFSKERNLKYIGYRSFWNTLITSYNIPEGVSILSSESIGLNALFLHLPSTLTEVGQVFTSQMEIEIADGCDAVKYDDHGLLLNKNSSMILLIPDNLQNLEVPNECSEINCVHIRNNRCIKMITVKEGNNAFFSYDNGLYENKTMELIAFPGNISTITIHPKCKGFASYSFATTFIENIIFNSNNFQYIGYAAFEQCNKLKSITLTSTITDINQYAFSNCQYLSVVEFSSSLRHIYSYSFHSTGLKIANFSLCKNLNSIDAYAFANSCLGNVVLPTGFGCLSEKVFVGCSRLSKIRIPESCNEIKDECFMNCVSLESIEFEGIPDLKIFSYNLFKNSGIKQINVPDSVVEIQQGCLSNCPNLTEIVFGYDSKLKTINKGSFVSSNSITILKLPIRLINIREQSLNEMYGLQNFEIIEGNSKFKTKNGVIFTDEYHTLFVFPGGKESFFIEDEVTTIASSAFFRCRNLINLTISRNSRIESIGENTFLGCIKLFSIEMPSYTNNLGINCFSDCSNLSIVKFGDNSVLKNINSGSFTGCTSLTDIVFGRNSSLETIGENAFKGCINIKSFTFPTKMKRILSSAFESCQKLSDIRFFDSNITEIHDKSFKDCLSLCKITFPSILKSIGTDAFIGCKNLMKIIYCGKYEITGNCFSGLHNLKYVCVSSSYPNEIVNFGGLPILRILDASCNFPTARFTVGVAGHNVEKYYVLLFVNLSIEQSGVDTSEVVSLARE